MIFFTENREEISQTQQTSLIFKPKKNGQMPVSIL